MNTPTFIFFCFTVGHITCYNVQRPYNIGPADPYSIEIVPSLSVEPSQRLFWGGQGSNQVGGNGLWATLTNKFPFLNKMFGRMELANQYGVPLQQYEGSGNVQPHYYQPQTYQPQSYQPQTYQPQTYQPQTYQQQTYPPQTYQAQTYQAQTFQQRQPLIPSTRDVGLTDDAVIVTPPHVPVAPQPVPVPAPQPAPVPAPQPSPGYNYNKPLYRLELPHK